MSYKGQHRKKRNFEYETRQCFSIRKFSFGAASVVIGMFLAGNAIANADTIAQDNTKLTVKAPHLK